MPMHLRALFILALGNLLALTCCTVAGSSEHTDHHHCERQEPGVAHCKAPPSTISKRGTTLLQNLVATERSSQPVPVDSSSGVFVFPPSEDQQFVIPPSGEQQVIVPLPMYAHAKRTCTNSSSPLGGDFLRSACGSEEVVKHDDNAEGHGSGHSDEHEHHSTAYTVILLLFYILLVGVVITFVLERYLPFVPFTAAVFVYGLVFVSGMQSMKRIYGFIMLDSYNTAVGLFEQADPHLMLYIFLPPLVFGEAMSLNVSMVKSCFSQCMTLAVFGVLIGAFLTALVGMYVLPYGWDFNMAMLFGSILSATDPVAVVAIFKSLGVSQRLTMLVSGESLFNDGTAMVLFVLFMDLLRGDQPSLGDLLQFVIRMTTLGPLMGAAMGLLAVWFIGLSVGQHRHGDAMGHVVISVCCAYLSFFLAEEMTSSGVLTLVTCGLVFANYARPLYVSRESMETIWHAIEFMGNTVIFALAGILFGGILFSRREIITLADCGYLVILYLLSTLIRAIMVGILLLPMNLLGQKISLQEAAVMVWSGMRGAVGLLLAVVADRSTHTSTEDGTYIMFHIGGMAAMMLLINGPLTPVVLRAVGLMDKSDNTVLSDVVQRLQKATQEKLKEETESKDKKKHLFSQPDKGQVKKMVEVQKSDFMHGDDDEEVEEEPQEGVASMNRLRALRESLMQVVQNYYWEMIDHGILARKSSATKALLDAADLGMMDSSRPTAKPLNPNRGNSPRADVAAGKTGLSDWDHVKRILKIGEPGETAEEYRRRATFCDSLKGIMQGDQYDHHRQLCARAAVAFMYAHDMALKDVTSLHGGEHDRDTPEENILREEVAEVIKKAEDYFKGLDEDVKTGVQTKMLATRLLEYQAEEVKGMAEKGLITSKVCNRVEHSLHKSATSILTNPLVGFGKFTRGLLKGGSSSNVVQ